MKIPLSLLVGGIALMSAAWAAPDMPYSGAPGATMQLSDLPFANKILVRKGERRIYLMHGEQVLRSYKVSLGLMPNGQKERAGDYRTPEGRYQLTRRNPHSDFFLSIQVSYPNADDVRRARQNGWDPGGSIMIHGLPNSPRHQNDYYTHQDWTDGCIALSNSDMLELWLLTQNNVPIEIAP